MTTWVFLRGLTRDARHWGPFPGHFEAGLPGARVVAVDLPGNGPCNAERSPSTVAGLLVDCRARLAAGGHAPPYAVLAMSLGAMVALHWAATRPGELRAAVLVNTSLAGISPWYQRMRPSSAAAFVWLALSGAGGDAWEAAVLRLTTRHPPAADALLRDWRAWRRERPVGWRNALRQLQAAARFRLGAAVPGVPLLLLAGARDGLVDVRCSRALALRCAAPLAEHPTAGHDLAVDAPGWVVDQVARWWPGVEAESVGRVTAAGAGERANRPRTIAHGGFSREQNAMDAASTPTFPFVLPPLRFAADALEPFFDAATLRLHREQHHRAEIDRLNAAIRDQPALHGRSIEDILRQFDELPEPLRTAVRDHGGGHANHQFLWKVIGPAGTRPPTDLLAALERNFGSFDDFRARFTDLALAHAGRGWAFLVMDPASGRLDVLALPDNDSVLPLGRLGLLICDLWPHAYEPRYAGRRADYLQAFWNVVDWRAVGERWSAFRRGARLA